jgi:perosamine synthetase
MKYPLFRVAVNIEESIERIRKVFESGYVNEGQEVTEFQSRLSKELDVTNLVLMNSCTSALTIAYKLAGVEPGTEVISSPMTCIATNTPIINLGGKVVWADIDPMSGNINPEEIESLVTERTKAIAYVNWAGNPAELEAIQSIGQRNGIKVIQDAAHSFGATWAGNSIAEYADFTCYSFQAIKHLSCGDGGALICKSDEDFALAKKLKWFGYDREATKDAKGEWKGQRWDAEIEPGEVGFKFNMNNIAAAIGLAGLEGIAEVLKRHRKNAAIYNKVFAEFEYLHPLSMPKPAQSSFWAYTCILDFSKLDQNLAANAQLRNRVIMTLNQEGVGAGLIHLPNDIYGAFGQVKGSCPAFAVLKPVNYPFLVGGG